MVSFEIDEAGFSDQPVFSADEEHAPNDLSLAPGVSSTNRTTVLVDDFEDVSFGEVEDADDRFEITPQPGAPVEEQDLVVEGLRTAVQQREDDSDLLDLDDPVPAVEEAEPVRGVPHITFDTKTFRATFPSDQGDLGHVDARVTYRGKNREMVIDDIGVLSTHLETDIPEQLLASAAEASRQHGILTVDSKVGNVRGLIARVRVFGESSLTFHDPEAKFGDIDHTLTVSQAARYLEPGDRTPLHVRAVLWNRPYAQLMDGETTGATDDPSGPQEATAVAADNVEPSAELPDGAADDEYELAMEYDLHDIDGENNIVAANGTILNEASFSKFYADHYETVRSYVARQFRLSDEDAEERAQNTFMRAWASRESFDGTNPAAWIITIAKNTARNSYNEAMRRPQLEANGAVVDETFRTAESNLASPEQSLLSAEASEELMRTFDEARLPTQWRQIMIMRVGLGMQYKEISERLNVPIGTVMSSIHRATKKLQTHVASRR